MAIQRQKKYCSSDEGPNCVFLQDEPLDLQGEHVQSFDEIMRQIQGVSEYDLILTFQTYDQITRRYNDFIPDPKLSADYGVFTIELFLENIKLSNDVTPKTI